MCQIRWIYRYSGQTSVNPGFFVVGVKLDREREGMLFAKCDGRIEEDSREDYNNDNWD